MNEEAGAETGTDVCAGPKEANGGILFAPKEVNFGGEFPEVLGELLCDMLEFVLACEEIHLSATPARASDGGAGVTSVSITDISACRSFFTM